MAGFKRLFVRTSVRLPVVTAAVLALAATVSAQQIETPKPGPGQGPGQNAQQGKLIPPLAREAFRNALLTFEGAVKPSNLEPFWKANGMALATRTLGRMGNIDSAQVMARDAITTLQMPSQTPVPLAFSAGPIYAILAQAFADLRDAQTAAGLVNQSNQEMAKISDPAVRANVMPALALTAIDLGQTGPAGEMILAGLEAAAKTPVGRERVSALATIATAQAALNQTEAATATIKAGREIVQIMNIPGDRAIAAALLARAEAANHNPASARSLARQAANDFDASTRVTDRSILLAVRTLGAIALAQAESGDRVAARSTIVAMRHTVEPMLNAYERFVGWLMLADTIIQVER